MVQIKPVKAIPYFLIIPVVASSPSPPNDQTEDNENDEKENTRGGCTSSCKCLLGIFGGLMLGALLIAAIAIPVVLVNLTTGGSETTIITTLGSTTSTAISSTTTDIPCSPSCTSQKRCVRGICVGIGYLSCTLTWSRLGDGDIVLTTPNNKTISFNNMGPSATTDEGQLDVDDTVGTGPENIFWSNSSSVPPMGVYYVCFSQYSFNPSASALNPITATIIVMRLSNAEVTVTKTFTSVFKNYTLCTSTSSNLLTSFAYP